MKRSAKRDRPLKSSSQCMIMTPFSKTRQTKVRYKTSNNRVASPTTIVSPSQITETKSLRLPWHLTLKANSSIQAISRLKSKQVNHQKSSTSTVPWIRSKTSSTSRKSRPCLRRLYSKWSQSWDRIATWSSSASPTISCSGTTTSLSMLRLWRFRSCSVSFFRKSWLSKLQTSS